MPPPAEVVDPVPAMGAPAALPDPLLLGAPIWDVGVEKVDVAPTGKAKCTFCAVPIPRNTARMTYYPAKSVIRYAHTYCADKVPAAHAPHSHATMQYQRHFVAGPHVLVIMAGIDEALALLP